MSYAPGEVVSTTDYYGVEVAAIVVGNGKYDGYNLFLNGSEGGSIELRFPEQIKKFEGTDKEAEEIERAYKDYDNELNGAKKKETGAAGGNSAAGAGAGAGAASKTGGRRRNRKSKGRRRSSRRNRRRTAKKVIPRRR